jgi:hypothetical protein
LQERRPSTSAPAVSGRVPRCCRRRWSFQLGSRVCPNTSRTAWAAASIHEHAHQAVLRRRRILTGRAGRPLRPAAPCAPAGPCAPAAPDGPAGPAGPAGPCAPFGPLMFQERILRPQWMMFRSPDVALFPSVGGSMHTVITPLCTPGFTLPLADASEATVPNATTTRAAGRLRRKHRVHRPQR